MAYETTYEDPYEDPYEIIIPGTPRFEATATDEGGSLLAAKTLLDVAGGHYGARRLARQEIIITYNGVYHNRLTAEARRS